MQGPDSVWAMSRQTFISFFFVVPLCFAQPVTLNLSSAEASANATVSLQCSFSAALSAPASLQWTLQVPPSLDIVGVEGTRALSEAGKSLVCKNGKCIVFGVNGTAIPSGPIAIVRIKIGQNTAGKQQVQIRDALAASADAQAIQVTTSTGVITISDR